MLQKFRSYWSSLRQRPRLSLFVDVVIIVLAFTLIHAWNTRELPSAGRVPSLDLAVLDSAEAAQALPQEGTGVVYFFAPWCFYCRNSIDNLEQLVASGDIDWARAVALEYANIDAVRAFVARTGFSQPVLLGNRQTVNDWNIRAFPTYFVFDARGNISSRSVGYSTHLGLWGRAKLAR